MHLRCIQYPFIVDQDDDEHVEIAAFLRTNEIIEEIPTNFLGNNGSSYDPLLLPENAKTLVYYHIHGLTSNIHIQTIL